MIKNHIKDILFQINAFDLSKNMQKLQQNILILIRRTIINN